MDKLTNQEEVRTTESLILSLDEKGNPYALVVDGKEVLNLRNVDFETEGKQMVQDWINEHR